MLELIIVKAKELKLGDVIGEGQEIWSIERYDGIIKIYWDGKGGSLLLSPEDDKHRKIFGENDLVKVIRQTIKEDKAYGPRR